MKIQGLMAAGLCSVLLAGCTTNPYTGEQQTGKSSIYGIGGAAAGAIIGAATSSKKDRGKGALIGATVGGAAGAGYGYYVDQQEARLRQELQGSGVQVIRNGDNLQLVMPGNITFASNSSDVSSSFYPTLNSLVKVFNEFDRNGIDIVGHTDSTGSQELNNRLSQQRASSVASYLTGQGVAGSRISSRGVGPSQPIATNDTQAGRAQNRRVEINLRPL
ncbi:MAG TPA: glycine zipper 2TM domain-containing protein [Pseudomonas xinjiangensis]|uniref:Glycine zipper 2TM domain-containing protein n=2 Tax=root TaxID=1 RepID=A0A7V1FSD0_9GAMM|nr:glycine zipper 2TM domain-containing protein [Halopseudomonas xinjiangensis]HEC48594.1 glycine zipper 2TM domain-containing protein [Halopseudomonas xinjiangensis]